MLSTFPMYIEGWLDICDVKIEDFQLEEQKLIGIIPVTIWHSKFCVLLENESKLYIFNDERTAEELTKSSNMTHCRLDMSLSSSRICDSFVDDASISIPKNEHHRRYGSNPLISQRNTNRPSRSGLFRNGSRLFRRGKTTSKFGVFDQPNKINYLENNHSTKPTEAMKRSLSLSRINRKKFEYKPGAKNSQLKSKNGQLSQSTGDLTKAGVSSSILCYYLNKETIMSEILPSIVGERPNCFSLKSLAEEISIGSSLDKRSSNVTNTTRLFAASSHLEQQCWMRRLRQTLKPNLENENRVINSMKLTIFESKCLPSQRRRYYCTVSIDNDLYAKTTCKLSNTDGTVFWAEEFTLNYLPAFKTVTIGLYKEPELGKDVKRKKKKNQNQCIGQKVFTYSNLNSNQELQSWYNLKSPASFSDRGTTTAVQIRMKIRFQLLKVLKISAYNSLYQLVTTDYLDLIGTLEKNLPIKLKEELAICLVNIHERNGSIIQFLIDLISGEVDDLDNSAMTLRANTIVTKIIESHMKLVGFQYLHDMLHQAICDVMFRNVNIEVDPSRLDPTDDHEEKMLISNQDRLIEYLMCIWHKIYYCKDHDFPKQLKSVFIGWRNKLTSKATSYDDKEKIDSHCDLIVSGCIFLRLICPAILSPYLFGLVSHFSENNAVQRTLTLIAKALQSLANFSKFGEKERFMSFLNSCFDAEIPHMHQFLRAISTTKCALEHDEEEVDVNGEIHYYGSVVDLPVEMARLYSCLMSNEASELIKTSPTSRNISQVPDIIDKISDKLQVFYEEQPNSAVQSYKKISVSSIVQNEQKNRPKPRPPTVPSMKSYSNRSQNPSSAVVLPHIGEVIHYAELAQVEQVRTMLNLSPSIIASSNMTDSHQSKSAIERNIRSTHILSSSSSMHSQTPERKSTDAIMVGSHYDKVNDNQFLTLTDTLENHISIDPCDAEFYRQNPLYDYISIYKEPNFVMSSTSSINEYFTIRAKLNQLEESIRKENGEIHWEQDNTLLRLRQQLDVIRKKIVNEQHNDLGQLKTILACTKKGTVPDNKEWSTTNPTKAACDSSQQRTHSTQMTTDAFDDVLQSIAIDGAGLDDVQELLRKQMTKRNVTVNPPRKPNRSIPPRTSQGVNDSQPNDDIIGTSPNRAISSTSSTCSSLMTGLI